MRYEFVGIIGTLFIILAFTFNDERKIRIFDMIGSFFFVAYGFIRGTYSNILLNGILICIHIVKLHKLKVRK